MSAFLDVILAIAAGFMSYLFVNQIYQPRTNTGKKTSIAIGILAGLAPLWYYAEFNDDLSHPIACGIFFFTQDCELKRHPSTHEEPPLKKTSPPPPTNSPEKVASDEDALDLDAIAGEDPYDHEAIIARARAGLIPKGWWAVGRPDMSTLGHPSESDAWKAVKSRPGSCEALRWYKTLYAGAHADLAENQLENIQTKTVTETRTVDYRHGPYAMYGSATFLWKSDAEICRLLSDTYNKNTSYCAGNNDSFWTSEFLRQVPRATPKNCVCRWSLFGYWCKYAVDVSCYINESLSQDVERCQ